MKTTAQKLALDIETGAVLLLQRVSRSARPEELAVALAEATGRTVERIESPVEPGTGLRLLDARGWTEARFEPWDAWRPHIVSPPPLVVLLDVASGRALLRVAPHVASVAGGVQLPVEPAVRPAQTEAEIAAGRLALAHARDRDPVFFERHLGLTVGVDLAGERTFGPKPGANALEVAVEELDEGIVYLQRWRG